MLRLLAYKNIYLLPVLAIAIFYVIPSLLGSLLDGRPLAPKLLYLSLISVFFYLVFYSILRGRWFTHLYNSVLKINIGWQIISFSIIVVYFSVIVYACITAPKIALFAALDGATMSELSGLREEFLRTRVGWEVVLLYIYAIGISALMPLTIAQMFISKSKWRIPILLLFLFSLSLTLEKGRSLVALLPLVVLFINGGDRKKAYLVFLILFLNIGLVSAVARGGLTSDDIADDPGPMAGVPDEYNLFVGETSQFYYLINRVWYIPYLTAIDWLRYKEEVLNSETVSGRSIGVVAWLIGEDKIYLEREVFKFEWGQNETGTGSANSVYYVDAYLNFGHLGIVLYTFLLALLVRVCICSQNKALIACLAISVYYVCFNSLSAVIFSGGLGFLFFLALFFRVKN